MWNIERGSLWRAVVTRGYMFDQARCHNRDRYWHFKCSGYCRRNYDRWGMSILLGWDKPIWRIKGIIIDWNVLSTPSPRLQPRQNGWRVQNRKCWCRNCRFPCRLVNNRVVAATRDDKEITELDVERVLQAARAIALPQERIIDVIPKEYIVDGYDGIRDPVGMLGVRLKLRLWSWRNDNLPANLLRCIGMAGFEVMPWF